MDLTEYHIKVLKRMKQKYIVNRQKLASYMHPDATESRRPSAIARVSRAINELELAGLIKCSNPSVDSWKLTKDGLEAVAPEPENEDGEE